jgi:periplasmic protein TonB
MRAGPMPAVPKNASPRNVTPPRGATPYRSRPPAILVTPPAEGSNPSKLIFPEKAISVSSSLAISSQLSVLVSPEPGPAAAHQPARLQAGELLFYAEPHFPKPKNGHGSTETIKVRATIGQQGQVIDVKPVSGPPSLFPAAARAIREWRYKPTLLNERPIQFQQDVTVEFRPPR